MDKSGQIFTFSLTSAIVTDPLSDGTLMIDHTVTVYIKQCAEKNLHYLQRYLDQQCSKYRSCQIIGRPIIGADFQLPKIYFLRSTLN